MIYSIKTLNSYELKNFSDKKRLIVRQIGELLSFFLNNGTVLLVVMVVLVFAKYRTRFRASHSILEMCK